MDRRLFLRASTLGVFAGAGSLLVTGWSAPSQKYFVSEDGDDLNTGRRPEEAWRTLSRVNIAILDGTIGYGNSILFRRGDEFFGALAMMPIDRSSADPPLTVSAFGEGELPKISGYKIVDDPEAWQHRGDDVWRINLVDKTSYRGNLANLSSNVGFLRVDGQIFGAKRWSVMELSEQWDFFNDSKFLFVKSERNPAKVSDDLRAAVDGTLITGFDGLWISDLEMLGSGGHAYRQIRAADTKVTGCRIHQIGGSQLGNRGRYGNGVEIFTGSSEVLVSRNEIYDVYDAACTLQGSQTGYESIEHCVFTSNTIWNCSQAFEYWGASEDSALGGGLGFRDCKFIDNTCINGGHSWGYGVRPDKEGKGNFVMAYKQELPVEITVSRNLFFDARDCYQFVNTNGGRLRNGFACDRNVIALRSGVRIQAQMPFTVEESADWVAATGQDANSTWLTVPSSIVTGEDALAYVGQNFSR